MALVRGRLVQLSSVSAVSAARVARNTLNPLRVFYGLVANVTVPKLGRREDEFQGGNDAGETDYQAGAQRRP